MLHFKGLRTQYRGTFFEKREEKRTQRHLRELSHLELCCGKVVRASEVDALAAVARFRETDGIELRAYQCRAGNH